MRPVLAAAAVFVLAACSPQPKPATPAPAPEAAKAEPPAGEPVVAGPAGKTAAPAGTYALDPAHSTVTFRLSHLGFSKFTASFGALHGDLAFDPANPAAMHVEARIETRSLTLPAPPKGFHDELTGKAWLDAASYPDITFRSTKVELTGPDTAKVTGDLTLHGVTRPVVLDARFNGGYAPNAFDGARVGFSATTTIKRSDFSVSGGIPAPGSNMGVGDHIEVIIETEWNSGRPVAPGPAS